MAKERLCIDIDNVIAQTDQVMRRVIRDYTRGSVDLTYDEVVEFDHYKCRDARGFAITRDQWREIHELFSEPENIMQIAPFPGAQEQLNKLREQFDIHYATSRRPRAWRATIDWLERHEFPLRCLHFLTHGEKHVALSGFLAAVEDHYEQAVAFASTRPPPCRCFTLVK
jgi:5'(3')-deoxyribonucleotidase